MYLLPICSQQSIPCSEFSISGIFPKLRLLRPSIFILVRWTKNYREYPKEFLGNLPIYINNMFGFCGEMTDREQQRNHGIYLHSNRAFIEFSHWLWQTQRKLLAAPHRSHSAATPTLLLNLVHANSTHWPINPQSSLRNTNIHSSNST